MARNMLPTFQNQVFWDWNMEIAKRTIPGYRVNEIHACHSGLRSSDGIVVLGDESGTVAYPTTAQQLTVVSSSAADDATPVSTTGALGIIISGVGEDDFQINENVDLNGTTPVMTTKSFRRVFQARAIMSSLGNLTNAGDITITHPDGLLQRIPAGLGREGICNYYANAGYKWYPLRLTVRSTGNATILLQQYNDNPGFPGGVGAWISENYFGVTRDIEQIDISQWIGIINSGRDFRLLAKTDSFIPVSIKAHMEIMRIEKDVAYTELV